MSLQTVLIANRGEIAGRDRTSLQALGLRALGVYSEADADAAYLSEMDQTVALGPEELSESYLSLDRLMEAAALGGADALHPGYGFLSRSPTRCALRGRGPHLRGSQRRGHRGDGGQGSRQGA